MQPMTLAFWKRRRARVAHVKRSLVAPFLVLSSLIGLIQTGFAQHYQQTNLVSDLEQLAKTKDGNLVNPWGITHGPTTPWWVADNGTGVSTLYNGSGQPFPLGNPLVVTIPLPPSANGHSAPTGIVFNQGSDFASARFIFATEDGTIASWNSGTSAILQVNNSATAIYKGITIAANDDAKFLYAANFHAGTVDVFDKNFSSVTLPIGAFTDDHMPRGFAPFNVQNIDGVIFVAFAKQDEEKEDEVAGAGLGFVDAFDANGKLLMRLKSGRWLNAPWAVALAPADFGKFSHHLLVGNFGSGQIAAFDPKNGNFKGLLRGPHGHPVTIEGLWGMAFGNDANAGPANTLFFAAGIDDEKHGLFGTLTPIHHQEGEGEED